MFTGLIQHLGFVLSIEHRSPDPSSQSDKSSSNPHPIPTSARILIDATGWSHTPQPGASIAVAGVCLTHAPHPADPPHTLAFDAVAETLSRTTLGSLSPGQPVNLESCLTPSTPLGGHFVQGHVDGVGRVTNLHAAADDYRLTIRLDPDLMPFLTPKGSIALDGVSLTIASIDFRRPAFTVALIPTTLERTTLGGLKPGDPVNVEADVLAKTVVHYLRHWSAAAPAITMDEVGESGLHE